MVEHDVDPVGGAEGYIVAATGDWDDGADRPEEEGDGYPGEGGGGRGRERNGGLAPADKRLSC